MSILHLGSNEKFLPPFIEIVRENFNFKNHEFLLISGMAEVPSYKNVKVYQRSIAARLKYYFFALLKMHRADKVILHGLFDIKLVFVLFLAPWLLRKCYWIIWGGDLYDHKLGKKNKGWGRREFLRRPVIRKMGHLVSYIKDDVRLAREWYGAQGIYHECIMYTSNLYQKYTVPIKKNSTLNIQVGNSADSTNNHYEVLEKLLPFKSEDIAIYVPLSYGDPEYSKKVILQGHKWFGAKFKPMTEFMRFEQYLEFLGSIDIAIFNHKRQQAMGNTITLLGLGKTVYLRSDTTQWQFFKSKHVVVGDIEELNNLELLNIDCNKEKITQYFSKENFVNQLRNIFGRD